MAYRSFYRTVKNGKIKVTGIFYFHPALELIESARVNARFWGSEPGHRLLKTCLIWDDVGQLLCEATANDPIKIDETLREDKGVMHTMTKEDINRG